MKGEKMSIDVVHVAEDGEVVENPLVILLKSPIKWEGKTYDRIDLTCLEDIKAADMIAVNRRLNRNGNVDFLQEMTLEYALNLSARAMGMPVEFLESLPPSVAMRIKNHVTGFLYRQE